MNNSRKENNTGRPIKGKNDQRSDNMISGNLRGLSSRYPKLKLLVFWHTFG
jgi:hypothetical protein